MKDSLNDMLFMEENRNLIQVVDVGSGEDVLFLGSDELGKFGLGVLLEGVVATAEEEVGNNSERHQRLG